MPKHKRGSSSADDNSPEAVIKPPRSKAKMAGNGSLQQQQQLVGLLSGENSINQDSARQYLESQDMEGMKTCLSEVSAELANTQMTCKTYAYQINVLLATATKQQQQIEHLQSKVDDQETRSMKDNIIIHNVPHDPKVPLVTAVKNALEKNGYTNVQGITFDRIHRAEGNSRGGKPRFVIAKTSSYKDGERLIYRKGLTKQLKQTGAWVSPQFSEKVRETRRQIGEKVAEIKQVQPAATINFKFTTLIVNGEIVKPALAVPSPLAALHMTTEERQDLSKIKFFSSGSVSHLGSTFVARCTSVASLNDVRKAYNALLLDPRNIAATHNIAGFILPDGSTGSADDGDYGLGRTIASTLKELVSGGLGFAVFVTRQYGGKKLGFERFQIVRSLVETVVPQNAKPQRPPRINKAARSPDKASSTQIQSTNSPTKQTSSQQDIHKPEDLPKSPATQPSTITGGAEQMNNVKMDLSQSTNISMYTPLDMTDPDQYKLSIAWGGSTW